MAFQTGSQVRPELGRADLSGFARSGESIGAALANLGAQVGGAIQVRAEKKKEKALSKQAQEMVFGMLKKEPAQADFFGLPEDFTLADVKPIVDIIGAKPSIALITQLQMASMEAGQTERPSIKDSQNLQEYVATLTSPKGNDLVIRNGMIYDEDIAFDDPLPKDDPAVRAALGTKEGQAILTGYRDATYLGTTGDDGTPADDTDTAVIDVEPEPTGSRLRELGGKAIDAADFLQETGTTMQSVPMATLNFLTSGDRPTFSESLDFSKPKMEALQSFIPSEYVNPSRFKKTHSMLKDFFQ